MILGKSFTKEWILAQRKANKGADPGLVEKQIYAFELLYNLIETGREFVFKGGTSLHLILLDHRRLSTDLDIVGSFTLEELTELISKSRFNRVEENVRKKTKIPKRHFKFFYTSVIDGRESYILLDTLEDKHTYPKIQRKVISSALFETDEDVSVMIPTIDGILGDKLTVFAPHTVGIPFGSGKSMEIVKQLFDIGELFNHCSDTKVLIESYNATQVQESRYRESKPSREDSLDDTGDLSYMISKYLLKGSKTNSEVKEIAVGIKQIANHLLGTAFNIDQARIAAAKAALLAMIIKKNDFKFEFDKMRYSTEKNKSLIDIDLSGNYTILNRLKKLQQFEAFYYWWIISKFV